MEKTIFVANGALLKIPKGVGKIRVQATQRGVSVVWKWSI